MKNAESGQSHPIRSGLPNSRIGSGPISASAYPAASTLRSRGESIRPSGYASSMCTNTARYTLDSSTPIVNSQLESAALSTLRKNANPTAVISTPKRLSGRRHQAYSPTPIHDQPRNSPSVALKAFESMWSEERAIARATSPTTMPSIATSPSARRSPVTG